MNKDAIIRSYSGLVTDKKIQPLVLSLIWNESKGKPTAVAIPDQGARGIMQLMPVHWEGKFNPLNNRTSVSTGEKYLRTIQKILNQKIPQHVSRAVMPSIQEMKWIVAGWVRGPNKVWNWGKDYANYAAFIRSGLLPFETVKWITKVTDDYRYYKRETPAFGPGLPAKQPNSGALLALLALPIFALILLGQGK